MNYIVGDIHGCFSDWIKLKDKLESRDPSATFTLIGDIIDRGSEVAEMLRWAIENITPSGKYQMILGNHEDEKIEWIRELLAMARIERDYEYALSCMYTDYYNFRASIIDGNITESELAAIYDLFLELPLYKEIKYTKEGEEYTALIVHAGIVAALIDRNGKVRDYCLNQIFNTFTADGFISPMKGRDILLWARNVDGYPSLEKTIVINGHTPTTSSFLINYDAIPGKVLRKPNNINVDCGMVFKYGSDPTEAQAKGNLVAYCLETDEEIYAHED